MLAEHIYSVLGPERRGLLLWASLWAQAGLGPVGSLTLSLAKGGALGKSRTGLQLQVPGQPKRWFALMSRAAQNAHFATARQSFGEAHMRPLRRLEEALGALLHEPELVAAWLAHASPTHQQWRTLATLAERAAEAAGRQPDCEVAELYLRQIASLCRCAVTDNTPLAPAVSSSAPTLSLPPPPVSLPPTPAPSLPPRPVTIEALAERWVAADDAARPEALRVLRAALPPHQLHAAYVAPVARALHAAAAVSTVAGWQLMQAFSGAGAPPALETATRTLLVFSAPQDDAAQQQAAQLLAQVIDAPRLARRLASEAPAALQSFARVAATRWLALRVIVQHERAGLVRAIAAVTSETPAWGREVRQQLQHAIAEQKAEQSVAGALVVALECAVALPAPLALSDAEAAALLELIDARTLVGEGLRKPLVALMTTHLDALPSLPCRSLALRSATLDALRRCGSARLEQLEQDTCAVSRADACPPITFAQARVDVEKTRGDTVGLLTALRRLTDAIDQHPERSVFEAHNAADSLLAGLRALYKRLPRDLLPPEYVSAFSQWLMMLTVQLAARAEMFGMRPTRADIAKVLAERQWDLSLCVASLGCAPLPLGAHSDTLAEGGLGSLAASYIHLLGLSEPDTLPVHIGRWASFPPARDAVLLVAISAMKFPARGQDQARPHRFACAPQIDPSEETGAVTSATASARQYHRAWAQMLIEGPLGARADDGLAQDAWYRLAPRCFALSLSHSRTAYAFGEAAISALVAQLAGLTPDEQKEVAAGLRGALASGDSSTYFRHAEEFTIGPAPDFGFCREHLLPVVVAFCRAVDGPVAAHLAERFLATCQPQGAAPTTDHECAQPMFVLRRLAQALGPQLLRASQLPASLGEAPTEQQREQALTARFLLLIRHTFAANDGTASARRLCDAFVALCREHLPTQGDAVAVRVLCAAVILWLQRTSREGLALRANIQAILLDLAALLAEAPWQSVAMATRANVRQAFATATPAIASTFPAPIASWMLETVPALLADAAPPELAMHQRRLAQQRALADLIAPPDRQSLPERLTAVCASVRDGFHIRQAVEDHEPALMRVLADSTAAPALKAGLDALSATAPNDSREGLLRLLKLCSRGAEAG